MFDEPVVYVDIETSGGSYKTSRIIEVAAIRVLAGEIVEEFHSLVNPGTRIPYWITNLTGISENDLVQAPSFADIAHQLQAILKDAVFIAHNVRFDYSFIKNELEQQGFIFNPKMLCTVRLSRALFPEHKVHKLESIIARHNISVTERHRARDDANAIFEFTKLAHKQHGAELFNEAVKKQLKTKTMPPHLDEQDMAAITNKTGVYIFEDENGTPLYIGKSVNIRSRILSHFSQDTKVFKEMKISQKTHNLRTVETGSELEALLLESKMIKELLPIYNKKLRRNTLQSVFIKNINAKGYMTIDVSNRDLSEVSNFDDIYGVYPTKGKAKSTLEDLMKTYQLCPKLMGLEKSTKACFSYQLGKCKGACIGKEPMALYNMRVEFALQRSKIASWPYKSPVAIALDETNAVVVDQWIVMGYLDQAQSEYPSFRSVPKLFDMDTYRILKSFIKNKTSGTSIVPYTLSV